MNANQHRQQATAEKEKAAQNTGNGISDGNQNNIQRLDDTKDRIITKFPPESQCSEILAHIQQHGSITAFEAIQKGIIGFHPRINELRNAGYPIVCIMEQHKNKHGKTVKRGRFYLASPKGASA